MNAQQLAQEIELVNQVRKSSNENSQPIIAKTQSGVEVKLIPQICGAEAASPNSNFDPFVTVEFSLNGQTHSFPATKYGKVEGQSGIVGRIRGQVVCLTIPEAAYEAARKAAFDLRDEANRQTGCEVVESSYEVAQSAKAQFVASQSGQPKAAKPVVSEPETHSCWECGYETTDASEIHPGNMGCVRCSGKAVQ